MAVIKILVTGGAGFIGSNTIDSLVDHGGFDISVIDDLSSGKREQVNRAARFHHGDLRDRRFVGEVIGRERP